MSSKKILVVDDDQSTRDLIEKILTQKGYEVICSASGKKALELVQDGDFGLVFTDLVMSGMEGDRLCAEVKKIAPKTEVVLISGFPLKVAKRLQYFLDLGGKDELLRKPLDGDKILEVAEKYLGDSA